MEFGVDSHEVFCFACTVVTVDIKISLTDALRDILLDFFITCSYHSFHPAALLMSGEKATYVQTVHKKNKLLPLF